MSTAAQRLQALATEQFSTLTPAEEHLLTQAANGKEAHYESLNEAENDPRQADTWGPERTVYADVLRWLCVDRDAIRHVDPKGLSIHGARIEGPLDLSIVTIPFPLFLVRCALQESMNLEFAEVRLLGIIGSTTQVIRGEGMVVHGDLRLRDGFDSRGGVNLFGATITNDLDCTGGRFHNAGGIALNVSAAKIDGSVILRDKFHAEGLVAFSAAHIQQHLDCQGASFGGDTQNGLIGESMVVGRAFDWREVTTNAATILNLAGAQVGQLADHKDSWPGLAHLDLDGFIYGTIVYGPVDAPTRIGWLARQAPVPLLPLEQPEQSPRPFRPQPYQQLAKVLREHGQEADAKQVLIAKEQERRKHGGLRWDARCWNRFLGFTIAYGYQPERLLLGALFFVLLGWVLFAGGYRSGQIFPAHAEAYTLATTGNVPAFYPTFIPWLYSLDTLLPIINFGQKDYWRPLDPDTTWPVSQLSSFTPSSEAGSCPFFQAVISTGVTSGGFLRVYHWVHIGVGWLLVTLGVAGVTGLVRKE
jgi:hypothetical protein